MITVPIFTVRCSALWAWTTELRAANSALLEKWQSTFPLVPKWGRTVMNTQISCSDSAMQLTSQSRVGFKGFFFNFFFISSAKCSVIAAGFMDF